MNRMTRTACWLHHHRWLCRSAVAGIALFTGCGDVGASAPMASPDLDQPGQPFTWAAFPTDEIGIADAREGTEITPSGSLFTGFGELIFLAGDPARPVEQRTRTLSDGDLPIVTYAFHDGDVEYQATMFAWALDRRQPDRRPVNHIRIAARNPASESRTTRFTVAFCYARTNSHRFSRPALPAKPGGYAQPGVEFDPRWTYGFQCDSNVNFALRSNQVVYTFPGQPRLYLTGTQLYEQPACPEVSPETPVLLAEYDLTLKPGERRELDFQMPVCPIPLTDAKGLQEIRDRGFDQSRAAAESWWRRQLAGGLQLHLGESKVEQTFRASLMYLILARDRVATPGPAGTTHDLFVQTVNRLQYHAFWLRDGSHMIHAYDLAGQAPRAAQALEFLQQYQKPDGEFLSQSGQHDGWGEALWAFGQHFDLTGDHTFARAIFPRVQRAVDWLKQARLQDPLHLLPGGAPSDDELPNGWAHLTGDNFYALTGLHEAIQLARAVDRDDLAENWQAEYRDYYDTLFQRLRERARTNGGYLPPCLDTNIGMDWGNLLALYPHPLLPPLDPLVTGTLNHALALYGEGLMCYGPQLHQYLTMNDTESWIIRGQQQPALDELYAILVHTSSTHAGWECGPPAWSTRDFGNDLAPHNWFAADYMAVVRNLLLREQDSELDLLSVLSPAWSGPGQTLWLTNAPTQFGPVTMHARFTASGMELRLAGRFRSAPSHLRVHFPWYVKVSRVLADGHPVAWYEDNVLLPSTTCLLQVDWQRTETDLSRWSYDAAVQRFKTEWRQRWEQANGVKGPSKPGDQGASIQ